MRVGGRKRNYLYRYPADWCIIGSMQGKKVLIVDDDPMITTTFAKLFSDIGATTETASTYEEGLAALKKSPPDVAILDLMLPHHSGLELIKEVRQSAPQTFFVMLTNSVNAEHVADAMESNVTMYIQKADHDPQDIVKMITDRFK